MDVEKTILKDVPVTRASIQALRKMLDIMEEFITNTEAEALENIKAEFDHKE